MSSPVVRVDGATKVYRSRGRENRALDAVSLEIGGGIHGLVGPNGSGKTTLMRALVGHVGLTAGSTALFADHAGGVPPLHEALRRTGVLIEAPRFFGRSTARDVLELHARTCGLPSDGVEPTLALVGLLGREDERVAGYSFGMRQRLGLAVCLLGDPALLIVDEPANGLDPRGMVQLRQLLRRLADDGCTILVSSHRLGELDQVCDSVTILSRGRCLFTGPMEALPARPHLEVAVDGDPVAAAAVLRRRLGADVTVQHHGAALTVRGVGAEGAAQVTRVLAAEDLWVRRLDVGGAALEDVFAALLDAAEPELEGVLCPD